MEKCLKEIEKIEQRKKQKESEVLALKNKLNELKGAALQAVLDKNNITMSELVETVSEFYGDSEEPSRSVETKDREEQII